MEKIIFTFTILLYAAAVISVGLMVYSLVVLGGVVWSFILSPIIFVSAITFIYGILFMMRLGLAKLITLIFR